MNRARALLLLCLFCLPAPLRADTLPTLAQALRAMPAAPVGDGSVALAVSPERVIAVAPAGDLIPTPQSLSAQYGRSGSWFGHVYALAPPTMTVLNTGPALADLPLPLLAAHHPLPFLVGTLTAEQVHAIGAGGLAFGDLTPDQQALFQATLPRPLRVVPNSVPPPDLTGMFQPGADYKARGAAYKAAMEAYEARGVMVPEETLASSLRLRGFLLPQYSFGTPDASTVDVDYEGGGAWIRSPPTRSVLRQTRSRETSLCRALCGLRHPMNPSRATSSGLGPPPSAALCWEASKRSVSWWRGWQRGRA